MKRATDRVVLALFAIVLVVAALDADEAARDLRFVLDALWTMAPFFLLAVAFAGFAKASGLDALIAKAFSRRAITSTGFAALVGALSPFCSCGVIPVIAGLLGAGVPLAPVMAFWIASPIMDPEMFVLTAAGLGIDFAIAKTVAAVAMGLASGLGILALQSTGLLSAALRERAGCASACAPAAAAPIVWSFWFDAARRLAFWREIADVGWFLGKWLALAFMLESLMVAYMPGDWIATATGAGNPLAIATAALVGMPSYLNGYAAIPMVSGLLDLGMSPGAAMAFMTAGAVSSVPAAIAVFALARRAVFAAYIVFGLAGAIIAGYAFQLAAAPS